MALGTRYDQQRCHLARALEVVGERWTLLILRDCFYGVRRFSDFRAHLDISRAVLSDRLDTLVDAGVVTRSSTGGHATYHLTEAGLALWPTIFALSKWGETYAPGDHPGRIFSHAQCGTDLDDTGRCPSCATHPEPQDLVVRPGPGSTATDRVDAVARELQKSHRMLTPIDISA
ncbi:MAG: helix-turn-helix domain-containing protein [Nocardioides sp.]